MTLDTARRLLDLSVEYANALAACDDASSEFGDIGTSAGRDPEEIAREYAEVFASAE